jgi:MerR family copper efflux transcriptional regulator
MSSGHWRIGQLAAQANVSTDSVRHYERLGLLPAPRRAANGYRHYSPSSLQRLFVIRNARRCGFSLRELAAFFRSREQNAPPCRRVRAVAAEKLAALDREIVELQALRQAMRDMLAQWDRRLAETPTGQPARLLDSLANVHLTRSPRRQPPVRKDAR